MSDEVYRLRELDLDKIQIRGKISSNNDFSLQDVEYRGRPLLIQTPNLYLPFGLSSSYGDSDRYSLNLGMIQSDGKHIIFQKELDQFDQHFKELEELKDSYQGSVKQNEDLFYPPCLKAKVHPQIALQVYDVYGKIKDLNYVIPGSWGMAILCPKYLWTKRSAPLSASLNASLSSEQNSQAVSGLTWYVLQLKVRPPIPLLDKCLIDDHGSLQNETLCSICYHKIVKSDSFTLRALDEQTNLQEEEEEDWPSSYQKYQKMLKLGIPILAVIQKCQMDGLDPEVLRQRKPTTSSSYSTPGLSSTPFNPPPPPPPPIPIAKTKVSSMNSGPPRMLFSAGDLAKSRAKLGQKKILKTGKINLDLRKRDPRVPSLDMILERLNQLRSTTD
jgi:hypothetical protein